MRKRNYLYVIIVLLLGTGLLNSCDLLFNDDDGENPLFNDELHVSIYDYIIENEDDFSSFLSILEAGGLEKTLSAYNPHGNGYTLFIPDNEAIERYIDNQELYSSLDDILNDTEFAATFCRYHVLNMSVQSNDFPYGAFPQKTLTEDFLTVSFILEEDSSYYKINNQAAVTRPNIELSNGYIHYIGNVLQPVTYTTYEWLENFSNNDYTIFKAVIDMTAYDTLLDKNINEDTFSQNYTLLMEADSIFHKMGIYNIDNLVNYISPNASDYTDRNNPLNKFVAYHILVGDYFIDDFEGSSTLYNTVANVPLNIDGVGGLDVAINPGKQVFDTIVSNSDTTFVDFIGVLYDESNILTQTGSIHFIRQVMTLKNPNREKKSYRFYENSFINARRNDPGTYFVDDVDILEYMEWSGADLYYVKEDENIRAYQNDYLRIDGDFEISYEIEPLIPGNYRVYIRGEANSKRNAIVEVFVDGNKISGLLDFTKGGDSRNPWKDLYAGTVSFVEFESHVLEIKTLIPGMLQWDEVIFEPF
jgi:uncharacterized surface protein with fasciclin (FAS1) repeats